MANKSKNKSSRPKVGTLKWHLDFVLSAVARRREEYLAPPELVNHSAYFKYTDTCWRYFLELIQGGQILWRHRLGDPRPLFREAIEVSRRAAQLWKDGAGKAHRFECNFPFGTAALVAMVMEPQLDSLLVSLMPTIKEWDMYPNFVYKFP